MSNERTIRETPQLNVGRTSNNSCHSEVYANEPDTGMHALSIPGKILGRETC